MTYPKQMIPEFKNKNKQNMTSNQYALLFACQATIPFKVSSVLFVRLIHYLMRTQTFDNNKKASSSSNGTSIYRSTQRHFTRKMFTTKHGVK